MITLLCIASTIVGGILLISLMVAAARADREIELLEPRDLLDVDDKI